MKIKPWPWISFLIRHEYFLWRICTVSMFSADRYVVAEFGVSHQEFKYIQMHGVEWRLHDKFRHAVRLMAKYIGEDPDHAVRRYMTLSVKVTP